MVFDKAIIRYKNTENKNVENNVCNFSSGLPFIFPISEPDNSVEFNKCSVCCLYFLIWSIS